jgi:RNA ligase (TIGR02306 family)
MSTHEIAVVKIESVLPHPNPEVNRMELTHVWGWQCCIGKGQFKTGDKAVYVPPDYMVPVSHPAFAFLRRTEDRTHERITVRRFKGALSQGLLIPVPSELGELPVGSNVIEQLGIHRYEPPLPKSEGGDFIDGPARLYAPKFDVESLQRYVELFQPGEDVVATEKLHGANARFTFAQNDAGEAVQFCGSRTNWMADDKQNIWWKAFRQNPAIGEFCEANPGKILYGEVFGQVQSLKYGTKPGEILFAGFAILDQNTWLDFDQCQSLIAKHPALGWAPLVYRGPFDLDVLAKHAEEESRWPGAGHMSEGVVITPVHERTDATIGRVLLKLVSNRYLEKA